MEKVLRPSTIIPSHLYVERAADRQLAQIVSDMGRPGYVLVARQMGKTNLLINMKREREALGDLVPYIDLTNRLASSRALFRNIIDTICNCAPDELRNVLLEIEKQRAETGLVEPILEYDRHLRLILRTLPTTRIIIVLDEVDSMISVDYSDTIFAQIRRMYFSRVNHPEFHRLTYALSGVAEPTDLIKDTNISPFNIGEKIYLDDFSLSEVRLLLRKAHLSLRPEVVDAIYYWASGNPRMTWDICSELEDAIIAHGDATKDDVQWVVNKLYLDRFDRAPIDHIRDLVERDAEVRAAITRLKRSAEDIDEKTRSRLYLAGVVGASLHSVHIKNRVIEAALSDSWISEVVARKQGLLAVAEEHFSAGRYLETIRLIEQYTREQGSGGDVPVGSLVQLGLAKHFVQDFAGAVAVLEKALDLEMSEQAIGTCYFMLGSALYTMNERLDEAIGFLQYAGSMPGDYRNSANVVLGSLYLDTAPKEKFDTILTLNRDVAVALEAKPRRSERDDTLLSNAYFNISHAYELSARRDEALSYLRLAFKFAPPALQPAILLREGRLVGGAERGQLAERAAKLIIETRLPLAPATAGDMRFQEYILRNNLFRLIVERRIETFFELLNYSLKNLYHSRLSAAQMLLVLYRTRQKEQSSYVELLWAAWDHCRQGADPDALLEVTRELALCRGKSRGDEAMQHYISALRKRTSHRGKVDLVDSNIILTEATDLLAGGHFRKALDIIELGKSVNEAAGSDVAFQAMLLQLEMAALRSLSEPTELRRVAEAALKLVDRVALRDSEFPAALRRVREEAKLALQTPLPDPYRHIGRNQRVIVKDEVTGRISNLKFKMIEEGIRKGQYKLLREGTEADDGPK
jgi:tetratricopeptide (TPR) repeat protein